MSHQLSVEKLSHYDTQENGITVSVTLRIGEQEEIFNAKIDTGASFCVFER